MSKALVVLSGGQDSTTCLGWALQHYSEVCAVTFFYGQKHMAEITAAQAVREYFEAKTEPALKIQHELIELPDGVFAGSSPLTNKGEELERYGSHAEMEKIIGDRVEKTFVPMRNAVFLMLAANRAVAWGCDTIVTGVCQGDNANYPDCRQDFITIAEATINEALGLYDEGSIEIQTPLMQLSKAQTCLMAQALGQTTFGALAFSHTAYDGTFPPTGDDHASVLRAEGFRQADLPDPLILRAYHLGLCPLPDTPNYRTNDAVNWTGRLSADWDK